MTDASETSAPAPDSASPVLVEMTAEIVSAYVAHNAVTPERLPSLIGEVHAALIGLGKPAPVAVPVQLFPAVPIKKSITDEYIISLEDGRKFKSLKRYLATSHNMTPEQYRAKWGLPADYPMVAPAYAKKRSDLARQTGLGSSTRATPAEAAA